MILKLVAVVAQQDPALHLGLPDQINTPNATQLLPRYESSYCVTVNRLLNYVALPNNR